MSRWPSFCYVVASKIEARNAHEASDEAVRPPARLRYKTPRRNVIYSVDDKLMCPRDRSSVGVRTPVTSPCRTVDQRRGKAISSNRRIRSRRLSPACPHVIGCTTVRNWIETVSLPWLTSQSYWPTPTETTIDGFVSLLYFFLQVWINRKFKLSAAWHAVTQSLKRLPGKLLAVCSIREVGKSIWIDSQRRIE